MGIKNHQLMLLDEKIKGIEDIAKKKANKEMIEAKLEIKDVNLYELRTQRQVLNYNNPYPNIPLERLNSPTIDLSGSINKNKNSKYYTPIQDGDLSIWENEKMSSNNLLGKVEIIDQNILKSFDKKHPTEADPNLHKLETLMNELSPIRNTFSNKQNLINSNNRNENVLITGGLDRRESQFFSPPMKINQNSNSHNNVVKTTNNNT